MSKRRMYLFLVSMALLGLAWMLSNSEEKEDAFSERVKIALREVGNQLLLVNQDSTSLVLPVIAIEKSKYKVSFQEHLSFQPNDLVSNVESAFLKSKLPKHYRVEVIQCSDQEVAYSYEMSANQENTIIPCAGRFLPNACYTIDLKFTKRAPSFLSKRTFLYLLILLVIAFVLQVFYSRRQNVLLHHDDENKAYNTIGSFQFYPEQNKLVKAATEISLSRKECELLAIFVAQPNQIIKRDTLTKRVWEDHGVFVGRSLDTYISKLRKKLKDDDAIKLTNVHGVGYMLEIMDSD